MEETSIIPIFTRRQMSGICVQVSVDVCTVTAQHSTLFAQWRPLRPWHGAQWHNISASTLSYPATDLCLVNDWHTSTLHLNNNFQIRERFSLFRQQSYREKSFWFYLNLKHCIVLYQTCEAIEIPRILSHIMCTLTYFLGIFLSLKQIYM